LLTVPGFVAKQEVLYERDSLLIPESARDIIKALLVKAHDEGGHFGADRTLARLIEARVTWFRMAHDVNTFTRSCARCQNAKDSVVKAGMMAGRPIPMIPWDVIVIDFVGPLPVSDGYAYILVIMDMFTRFCELVPTKTAGTEGVRDALTRIVFLRYGIPRVIQSDQGSHFTSKVMADLAASHGFYHHFTEPRRPESNGMLERNNLTIVNTIRAYVDRHSSRWVRVIGQVQWDINTAVNSAMSVSPYTALYGYHPRTRVAAAAGVHPVAHTMTSHHAAIEAYRQSAHDGILRARAANKLRYDAGRKEVELQPNSFVQVRGNPLKEHKLHIDWSPICQVVRKINDLVYEIRDPVTGRVSSQHVSMLRPFNMDRTSLKEQTMRLLDEGYFIVENILDHRKTGYKLELLVKFEGVPEPTWQDVSSLTKIAKVNEYARSRGLKDDIWIATSRAAAAFKRRKEIDAQLAAEAASTTATAAAAAPAPTATHRSKRSTSAPAVST
jgi:transposase InsO family protein